MQFYRPYKRPIAIGFDLDDTLYDNLPILLAAEDALHEFMVTHFPQTADLSIQDWTNFRLNLVANNPALSHDVTEARLQSIYAGLNASGYDRQTCEQGSQQALTYFLTWRNKINITADIHQLLSELSQQFRLFVISNGNADITQCGLTPYFEFAMRPSQTTLMKPASDLFRQAEQRLGLNGCDILYVGDHPVSDIVGSGQMGWQNAWLNSKNQLLNHYKKPQMLPTFEMNKVTELAQLLHKSSQNN